MKWLMTIAALCAAVGAAAPQDHGAPAKPQKEHEWFKALDGDWLVDAESTKDGGPPRKGFAKGKLIGGFWLVLENRFDAKDQRFTSVMTIGFDPGRKKYVASWIDSTSASERRLEGTLDPASQELTFEADAPSAQPGRTTRIQERIMITSPDRWTITCSRDDGGTWTIFKKVIYNRKES